MKSKVEVEFLGENSLYTENQKSGVVVVTTIPDLGKLTARYFLEWVSHHPEGVVSLPTGRSPLSFIQETHRLLASKHTKETQHELSKYGIEEKKLSLRGLTFVHMDEIYPIDPTHTNSFLYFVRQHYFKLLGFDEKRALIIDNSKIGLQSGEKFSDVWRGKAVDLSLRVRSVRTREEKRQKSLLHAVDQWCMEYEERIRRLGGIDFFLGGIGPDGHIAFNISGSSFYSTTRLTELNYQTKAATAVDMGGMEIANRTHAITIGLGTIAFNPQVIPIIIAAGESKSKIVAASLQSEPTVLLPATSLHRNPHTRFFLTEGAANQLKDRKMHILSQKPQLSEEEKENIIITLSLSLKKPIAKLTTSDIRHHAAARILQEKGLSLEKIRTTTIASLLQKITRGSNPTPNTRFLHTEPHHDDIMLGYLPFALRTIREHSNTHHFATFTLGYTAITNYYMRELCTQAYVALKENHFSLQEYVRTLSAESHPQEGMDAEVLIYLDGLASRSKSTQNRGVLSRLLRILCEVFHEFSPEALLLHMEKLINYFSTQYSGKKDPPSIQIIKGRCREWESACLWGYWGYGSASMHHMNLSFYQNPDTNSTLSIAKDAATIAGLLSDYRPDVLTLAFDPEGSGPATHYKVLKALAAGLDRYLNTTNPKSSPTILGYRNVWFRFLPSEANIMVPVSLNMFALQETSFLNSYLSQKNASFPSPDYDGLFCEYAQEIQVQQYEMIKTCLGEDFFYQHQSPLIRATRGLVFLKSMTVEEFFTHMRSLEGRTESSSSPRKTKNHVART